MCSNYGNWNYAAGIGNDPRENRKFNMVKQGLDYDPEVGVGIFFFSYFLLFLSFKFLQEYALVFSWLTFLTQWETTLFDNSYWLHNFISIIDRFNTKKPIQWNIFLFTRYIWYMKEHMPKICKNCSSRVTLYACGSQNSRTLRMQESTPRGRWTLQNWQMLESP